MGRTFLSVKYLLFNFLCNCSLIGTQFSNYVPINEHSNCFKIKYITKCSLISIILLNNIRRCHLQPSFDGWF